MVVRSGRPATTLGHRRRMMMMMVFGLRLGLIRVAGRSAHDVDGVGSQHAIVDLGVVQLGVEIDGQPVAEHPEILKKKKNKKKQRWDDKV